MSTQTFTPTQRLALYLVHEEKCYLCNRKIAFSEMQIEHILPEDLAKDKPRLKKILDEYGLDENFDLRSFANLLPSCAGCNREKSKKVFEAVPILKAQLDKAAEKEADVITKIKELNTQRAIERNFAKVIAAAENGKLTNVPSSDLKEFFVNISKHRSAPLVKNPLKLTTSLSLSNDDFVNLIKDEVSQEAERLADLELASRVRLSELEDRWNSKYLELEQLLREKISVLKGQGISAKLTPANSRPELFEVIDGWHNGVNPKKPVLTAHFEHASLTLFVHPGAITQGKNFSFRCYQDLCELVIWKCWENTSGENPRECHDM